jgi:hypothetical protein
VKRDATARVHRTHGEDRNVYTVLLGTSEWNRSLGRSKFARKDNIKVILKAKERDAVDRKNVAQIRARWRDLVNMILNLRVL